MCRVYTNTLFLLGFSTVLFTLKAFMKAIPASWKFRKDLASSFEQDICEGYS